MQIETHPKTGLRRVSANPYHHTSGEMAEHMAALAQPATLANPNPLRRLSAAGTVPQGGLATSIAQDGTANLTRLTSATGNRRRSAESRRGSVEIGTRGSGNRNSVDSV